MLQNTHIITSKPIALRRLLSIKATWVVKCAQCLLAIVLLMWGMEHARAGLKPSGFLGLGEVPGINSVEFLNYDSNTKIVKVKLWGIKARIQKFKDANKNKYYAIAPESMSLSHVLPMPSKSPIQDLTIDNSVLIYVPSDSPSGTLALGELPSDLQQTLAKHSDGIELSKGFNLISDVEVVGSDTFKNFLKKASIRSTEFSLSVALHDEVLSKSVSSYSSADAQALLSGIDLKIQMPSDLRIPHLARVKKISAPKLSINFVDGNGSVPKVTVAGELDLRLARSKYPFDVSLSVMLNERKFTPSLTASSNARMRMTLLGERVYMSNLQLEAGLNGTKWDLDVSGVAEINGQTMALQLADFSGSKPTVRLSDGLLLQNLLSADMLSYLSLDGVSNGVLNNISMNASQIQANTEILGQTANVSIFLNQKRPYMAIEIPNITNINELLPELGSTLLDGTAVDNLHFVYVPHARTIKLSNMPKALVKSIRQIDDIKKGTKFSEGLHMVLSASVKRNSLLEEHLEILGVNEKTMPFTGTLDPVVFVPSSQRNASMRRRLINSLDLTLPLSNITPQGLSGDLNILTSEIHITGEGGDSVIQTGGQLDLTVGQQHIDMSYRLETSQQADGETIVSMHMVDIGDLDPSYVGQAMVGNGASVTGQDTSQFADATVVSDSTPNTESQSNRNVDESLETLANLDFGPALLNIPGIDDLPIANVVISEDRASMTMDVLGIDAQLSMFKINDQWLLTVNMNNGNSLQLTDLMPIAGIENTPLSGMTFADLSFVVNLSQQAINVNMSQLPSDIAAANSELSQITLNTGINVLGHVNLPTSGPWADMTNKIGLPTIKKLPVRGGMAKSMFNSAGGAVASAGSEALNELLSGLDIKLPIPSMPALPGLEQTVSISDAVLRIKGLNPMTGEAALYLPLAMSAEVKLPGKNLFVDLTAVYQNDGSGSDITMLGTTTESWSIASLELNDLSLAMHRSAQSPSFDFSMAATSQIGGTATNVEVELTRNTMGKVIDAAFALDAEISLADIPGFNSVDHADQFTLNNVQMSSKGLAATTLLKGLTAQLYVFNHTNGLNLVVVPSHDNGMGLAGLIPDLKNTPLEKVVFSELALVVSKNGINADMADLSAIAQQAMGSIYGESDSANVKLADGLSLIAAFESSSSPDLADSFSRIGLPADRLTVTGGIGGIFGGDPSLDLSAAMSAYGGASQQPTWLKVKDGAEASFYITVRPVALGLYTEMGIATSAEAKLDGDFRDFEVKTGLVARASGLGVKIFGQLQSEEGWTTPFGLPGLTLNQVGMSLGIDVDSSMDIGFVGNTTIGGQTVAMAAAGEIIAGGVPKSLAFKGQFDSVDMNMLANIAGQMSGNQVNVQIPTGVLPEFSDVEFMLVPPDAVNPDLGIDEEGFVMKGKLDWLGKNDLAEVDAVVSTSKGIHVDAQLADFEVGPLKGENNFFTLDVPMPTIGNPDAPLDAALIMNSDVDLLGLTQKLATSYTINGVEINSETSAGSLLEFKLAAKSPYTPLGLVGSNFFMRATLQSDPVSWLKQQGPENLRNQLGFITEYTADAQQAVNNAQSGVDNVDSRIAAREAKLDKIEAARQAKIQLAQDRVNNLNGQILSSEARENRFEDAIKTCDQKNNICIAWKVERKGCKKKIAGRCIVFKYATQCSNKQSVPDVPKQLACQANNASLVSQIAAEQVARQGLEASKDVADAALAAAKKSVQIIPNDLDPELMALRAEKLGLDLALQAATATLNEAENVVNGLLSGMSLLQNMPDDLFVVHYGELSGDLAAALNGDPVVLALDAELDGNRFDRQFAFTLGDPEYNTKVLGFMALDIVMKPTLAEVKRLGIVPSALIRQLKTYYTDQKTLFESQRDAAKEKLTSEQLAMVNAAITEGDGDNTAADPVDSVSVVDQFDQAISASETVEATAAAAIQTQKAQQIATNTANYKALCAIDEPKSEASTYPLFDACYYLETYPDVQGSVGSDKLDAERHWLASGIAEGRQPSANVSMLALAVRNSGASTFMMADDSALSYDFGKTLDYWIGKGGLSSSLDVSPLECEANNTAKGATKSIFDPCFYAAKYADVAGADYGTLHSHWRDIGLNEGRLPSADFSFTDYLLRNQDLFLDQAESISQGDYASLIGHWQNAGSNVSLLSALPTCSTSDGLNELSNSVFDPCYYANANAQLKTDFGYDKAALLKHYLSTGIDLGTQSNDSFDINSYFLRYFALSDTYVDAEGIAYRDLLQHWQTTGQSSGHDASPYSACGQNSSNAEYNQGLFDPCFYMDKYDELEIENKANLATQHFYTKGIDLGYSSAPNVDLSGFILRDANRINTYISAAGVDYRAAWEVLSNTVSSAPNTVATIAQPLACTSDHHLEDSSALAQANSLLHSTVFDPCFYLEENDDVASMVDMNKANAVQNWLYSGADEGRVANDSFYAESYMLRYEDLREDFITDQNTVDFRGLINHWVTTGVADHRKAGKLDCDGGDKPAATIADDTFDPCKIGDTYQSRLNELGGDNVKLAVEWLTTTCSAGYYRNYQGPQICTPARAGHYIPNAGAVGKDSQQACQPGYYANGTGRSACTLASKGHYVSTVGATRQIACQPGRYNPNTGSTSASACRLAERGTYVSGSGASDRQQCWPGTYQDNEGRTSCKTVDANHFTDHYKATGQSACDHRYNTEGKTGNTSSSACIKNKYDSPEDYYNNWGTRAPGTKDSGLKCKSGKNWKRVPQECN